MKLKDKTVLIIGVGLIGGSLGKALKKRRAVKQVLGYSRKKSTLSKAKKNKAIDKGSSHLDKLVPEADIIVIATPIDKIVPIAKKIAPWLKEGAVVTDVGSVKQPIVSACQKILKKTFIGSHPMAGSEQSGIEAAHARLFEKAVCILTPTSLSNPSAIQAVQQLWLAVGARIKRLSPKIHDNITAYISHVPHLLSVALVQSLNHSGKKAQRYIPFVGSGFKDMSRIAEADPKLWKEILLSNSKEIQKSLSQNISILNKWKKLLDLKDINKISASLKQAQSIRRKLK